MAIRARRLPNQNLTLHLPSHITSTVPSPQHSPSLHRLSDFQPLKLLGRGNGGSVRQLRHRRTSALFALKTPSSSSSPRHSQLAREIEILRSVDSPSILRLHAVLKTGPTNTGPALLLEFMNAGSLHSLLARSPLPFPEPAVSSVARQTLHGLSYLHSRGIVHGDIKPGNLLANTDGEIKIADFGVSKIVGRGGPGTGTGTAAYMSPERFDPEGDCDECKADVWSLGMSLLEIGLGYFPLLRPGKRLDWAALMCAICFGGVPEMPETASGEFRDFVGRCLEKEVGRRWSVAELAGHPFVCGRDEGESDRVLREFILGAVDE